VHDLGDAGALRSGEVLVAPATDPSWTPLFLMAGAVVVERGGPLSHAAIVAREFGLPAVLNARDATVRLADGMIVDVDGSAGTVTPVHPADDEAEPAEAA
jgi:pyruvate,water dikinase